MTHRYADTPEVRRVSYVDAARASATKLGRDGDHPDRPQTLAAAAAQLDPLQRIQHVLDALVRTANDLRAGAPDPHNMNARQHAEQTLDHVRTHRDVLRAAADAADAMIDEVRASLEPMMSKDKDRKPAPAAPAGGTHANPAIPPPDTHGLDPNPEHPQLTTSGAPHPLEKGGYDADADPQLPGNISDVEALKEGKATRRQTEAENAAAADEAKEKARAAKAAEKGTGPGTGQGPAHGPKK